MEKRWLYEFLDVIGTTAPLPATPAGRYRTRDARSDPGRYHVSQVGGPLRGNRSAAGSSKPQEAHVSSRGKPQACSDAALVSSAQQGDTAAFDALVGRYQDRIYNLCYRICGNEADAQDLAQTTFLRAFQALSRFEARCAFYTWIFRIATNVAISHLRKRSHAPLASLDAAQDDRQPLDPPADTRRTDPHRQVEQVEQRRQVESALARLPAEFRVAVVLKDIEQMDYATIAEVLGVPIGTVRSRISRGRMMLRTMLREELEGSIDHAAT